MVQIPTSATQANLLKLYTRRATRYTTNRATEVALVTQTIPLGRLRKLRFELRPPG